MPLQTGSDRASPWLIFGNLLAQGVAMLRARWRARPSVRLSVQLPGGYRWTTVPENPVDLK